MDTETIQEDADVVVNVLSTYDFLKQIYIAIFGYASIISKNHSATENETTLQITHSDNNYNHRMEVRFYWDWEI